ncbi:glycosyltransferase [Thomasclavelia spiroformis]|uniref:glycosyltransferase n=1 Tax=Thomasclavelia spiroformis TaxID=29348 RepID=UPI00255BE951|nr:glycosyltransferase [Thomasclavelia spiroformis]
MKKKICILSNGLVRGGTDTFVVNLVKGLNKEYYDITVVLSISDAKLAIREPEILSIGSKTIWTNSIEKGLINKLKHLLKLFVILKKGKFDIFQTNIDLFNGPNLFVAWLARVPIRICHSHNSRQEREVQNKSFVIIIYQKIMKFLCWNFANRYCGCSELALNFLFDDKWKNNKNAQVINNGIDIDMFKNKTDISLKKKELNFLDGRKYILTVGRLSSQKNPLMIVDIFFQLCNLRDDCDLVWVGDGEMMHEIISKIKLLKIEKRVHFLGLREDVNEIMQCCDIFLFPSIFEGLGIVVIEAQAAGLPCLISNTIPTRVDCGGCIFEPLTDSVKDWASMVNKILNNDVKINIDMKKVNEFSISTMVNQMENLF